MVAILRKIDIKLLSCVLH